MPAFAGMTSSAILALLDRDTSRFTQEQLLDPSPSRLRKTRLPYSTPLLLGTPFTLREGATAMATARANALKMDSRQ